MPNLKEVRTRIASVSSTQQITSAMKMVSAAKFRRAQNNILSMRPYAQQLGAVVADIDVGDGLETPYHVQRPLGRVLLIVVTSNKGLCGAFNANVLKQAEARIRHYRQTAPDVDVELCTIGKRAADFFARRADITHTDASELLDVPTFDNVAAFVDDLMERYAGGDMDRVELVYNQFKNSLTQILTTEQYLPLVAATPTTASQPTPTAAVSTSHDYIFEPTKADILRQMVPLTLRSHFFRVILDSLAAEHGARMTAMQKATDNATELLKDLRLTYNKARQAAITNEIIEIVSGSEALKG